MITNAQATALQAQLAAYASTAAIPIVGPAMAPAALTAAIGVTEPLVAAISGLALAGMAHDGIDKIPETGTWLLKKGSGNDGRNISKTGCHPGAGAATAFPCRKPAAC
jgi:hypothetical protein